MRERLAARSTPTKQDVMPDDLEKYGEEPFFHNILAMKPDE